jgi:hypothetical protein
MSHINTLQYSRFGAHTKRRKIKCRHDKTSTATKRRKPYFGENN